VGSPDQFVELIKEIKYACNLIKDGKYNLGQYYHHMADFFVYIDLPEDAEEHRVLARTWEIEKGENNET
jgi:pantothenate kinase